MPQPETEPIVVPARFNGPNASGNGGWVAGTLAERLARGGNDVASGPVRVTLRLPPPLETALTWADLDGRVELRHGGEVVGEATAGSFAEDTPPEPVTPARAARARDDFAGHRHHPFPRCFTCGTDRAAGDGLRLFTGPVDEARVAATWTPHPAFCDADEELTVPCLWAALDCPGGWAAGIGTAPMVLGRMTVEHGRPPRAGEECVAVGALREVQGRKHLTSTVLHGADGRLIGRAEQVWISIDLDRFS